MVYGDNEMRIAIVGSREYAKLDLVRKFVSELPADTVIVSGGARGVDQAAEFAAKARGLETVIFPAMWGQYGKRAGFMRNRQIVEASDRVVAFWDGFSAGTLSTIKLAQEAKKTVEVIR
jgi:predicted Rossmann fold nucleotide-binding protein DprA/Smf involved in DNA uptake